MHIYEFIYRVVVFLFTCYLYSIIQIIQYSYSTNNQILKFDRIHKGQYSLHLLRVSVCCVFVPYAFKQQGSNWLLYKGCGALFESLSAGTIIRYSCTISALT